jgi:hypothetical protein
MEPADLWKEMIELLEKYKILICYIPTESNGKTTFRFYFHDMQTWYLENLMENQSHAQFESLEEGLEKVIQKAKSYLNGGKKPLMMFC